MTGKEFLFRGKRLILTGKPPLLMGILNLTPDSFSDGGKFFSTDKALDHALEMLDQGADIIDAGGESTRPGAPDLSDEEECDRVVPLVKALRKARPDCTISIDTRKAKVARASLEAGADIINDVSGLQYSPDMARTVAEYQAGLVIMHMRGTPSDMQKAENLIYKNLCGDILEFLNTEAEKAISAGVKKESIIFDPGIGFSKSPEQNIELVRKMDFFGQSGYPVLAGFSRKTFLGKILGESVPEKRLNGNLAVSAFLFNKKTEILRVHDVREIKEIFKVLEQISD